MKNKIVVGYSTNRDEAFVKQFNEEINSSVGCDCEIRPFHNTGNISLTEAYNTIWSYAEKETTKSIFVFIHHDIHFKTQDWGKVLLYLFNREKVDILGVAGTSKLQPHCAWWLDGSKGFNQVDLWGKVSHTNEVNEWKSDFTTPQKTCKPVQEVVAIDGLFLAFNPATCEMFDEEFGGFHFYDISWCIKNVLAKKTIAVTEKIHILHESEGPLSEDWERNRIKLCNKYSQVLPLSAK